MIKTDKTYTSLDFESILSGDSLEEFRSYQKESGADGRIWKISKADGSSPFNTRHGLPNYQVGKWAPDRSHHDKWSQYWIGFSPLDWLTPNCRLYEVEIVLPDSIEGRIQKVTPSISTGLGDNFLPVEPHTVWEAVTPRFRYIRERPDMIPAQWNSISKAWNQAKGFNGVRVAVSHRHLLKMTHEMLGLQEQLESPLVPVRLDRLSAAYIHQYYLKFVQNHMAHPLLPFFDRHARRHYMLLRLYCGLLAMEGMTFKAGSNGADSVAKLLDEIRPEWEMITS